MSNAARTVIPTTGDNGKTVVYNEGLDQWDLVDPATQSELNDHLNDTVDAHDASAISFVPTGTIVATDTQAAVAEVASEAATNLSNHEADTTAIHGIADTSLLLNTTTAPEIIRDTMGTALVAGTNIDITVNDPSDTITISAGSALATDAEVTTAVSNHAGAADPHGDRAFATSAVSTHEADTTSVHGVANMAALITKIVTDAIALGSAVEIGNGTQALQIWSTATGPVIESKDNQKITIGDGASAIYVDVTNGRVGIGPSADVAAPSALLHVSRPTSGQATLFRNTDAAGTTGALLKAEAKTVGSRALQAGLDTDTVARFNVDIDGGLAWGAGGASTRDTNLYRSAADILKTDDNFDALTLKQGGIAIEEVIRDTMGTALVAGTNVTITPNDGADTITIASTGGSGDVGTDVIWDAKGDLAGGTGPNTAIRLAVGANDTYLVADSAAATGMKWAALDAELLAIAGLVSAADRLPYFTGVGTASLATFTAAGRALIDDADNTAQRVTLGLEIGVNVQAFDAELAAIAGLTSVADRLPYFTGSGTAALATFTGAGRALVDDADNTAQRVTLGLEIGVDVQAFDAELAAIAGLTSVADRLPYFTGSGTAALATFTATGRSLVDDASVAAMRVTLEVDKRTTFTNADYTSVAGDKFVAQVGTLSAPRTVTLPAANAVNAGEEIIVSDESGSVTGTNTIIITRAGADTLNGGTTVSIPTAYGSYTLVSNGTNAWTAVTKGTRLFYGTAAPANPSVGDMWLDTTV